MELVILGAGPSGLAAAWRAALRGVRVTVLERSERVGGLSAGLEVAGISVDHGSHRLHPATPPHLLADLRGLLGDDLQVRPRNGRLRVGDRFVGFPLRPGELARRLPYRMLAGIARDAVLPRGGDDSFAGLLRASLGPTLYRCLYEPYAVKLWGLPGEEIDGDQARRRVTADSPWKIARRVLRGSPNGQGKIFYYPRRGFGQIVEAMADAAVAAGADLRLGTACESLVPGPSGVAVHTSAGRLDAGHVFSTIPMPALAGLVRPGPASEVVAAARQLEFRAMVLVYAVHEGGRWSPYDAHYLPGPETPVTRISEPANYRVSAADPADRTVLCFEIPCQVGDPVWTAHSYDDLIKDCLSATGLPPLRLAGVEVRRLPHVYPVYRTGYADHLAGLDAWAGRVPHVTTFGRLGLFAHDNTHHAMAMAYAAVDALTGRGPGEGWDAAAWMAARARFAEHVVED
ncbi:protoporphyrinogen/coproporphyrinogen oxidase [Nonomuraea sp. NPDC059194]|uniref:protoporphyrinogen/coproporphyrinogen oxidase n=1 Tax=Nonomuraea sp. NPDC059194 TaxID=3346764 RepID=UPI00369597FC